MIRTLVLLLLLAVCEPRPEPPRLDYVYTPYTGGFARMVCRTWPNSLLANFYSSQDDVTPERVDDLSKHIHCFYPGRYGNLTIRRRSDVIAYYIGTVHDKPAVVTGLGLFGERINVSYFHVDGGGIKAGPE